MLVTFLVKGHKGLLCTVTLDDSLFISDLIARVAELMSTNPARVRLVTQGQVLEPPRTIISYLFTEGTILYVSVAPSRESLVKEKPEEVSGGLARMLQNPMVSGIIDSMAAEPGALQDMVEAIPGFKNYVESNPEVAHALRDPDTEEILHTFRNPRTARYAAKQLDSALDSIEAHPHGLHTVRRQIKSAEDAARNSLVDFLFRPPETRLPPETSRPSSNPLGNPMPGSVAPLPLGKDPQEMVKRRLDDLRREGIVLHELPGMASLARFLQNSAGGNWFE
jgi:hypothetical protein